MTLLQALLLGILQGITEFFPVSSSTHLLLAKRLLAVQGDPFLFDLSCHAGTLFALLFFLRKELPHLFKRPLLFALGLLPLVPAYLLLRSLRETPPTFLQLGCALIVTAGFLLLAMKWRMHHEGEMKRHQALCIGTLQAAALIPGISRSASTISCARVLGISGAEAVRFSFLLSIPAVGGGVCLELLHTLRTSALSAFGPAHLIGFFSAFLIGSLIIPRAFRLLAQGRFTFFVCYCFLLGALLILL